MSIFFSKTVKVMKYQDNSINIYQIITQELIIESRPIFQQSTHYLDIILQSRSKTMDDIIREYIMKTANKSPSLFIEPEESSEDDEDEDDDDEDDDESSEDEDDDDESSEEDDDDESSEDDEDEESSEDDDESNDEYKLKLNFKG